jgi:enoyl-CoA hydratase/carnithine racemase
VTGLVRRSLRRGFDSLVLDSQPNRNALSLELLEALLGAVRESAASESRGLVIEHAGPSFCSGIDLKERSVLDRRDSSHSLLLAELLRELWIYPKPAVAVVDGAARGGGLGLLACMDVVVASRTSTFAYSESRVGVAPALVMAVTLPTTQMRALMPHLLSGAAFDAAVAMGLGLVHLQDVPTDSVLDSLAQGAPNAQATIKRLSRQWAEPEMDGLIAEMTALSGDLFTAEEAREGMAAFAERRATAWSLVGAS